MTLIVRLKELRERESSTSHYQLRRVVIDGVLVPEVHVVLVVILSDDIACDALAFDQHLVLEIGRGVQLHELLGQRLVHWKLQPPVLAELLEQVSGNPTLLLHPAVHLEREDDRVR